MRGQRSRRDVRGLGDFRLGLLVPSSNTTMEKEFNLMRPKSATVHAARVRLREVVVSELLSMEREIELEALKLSDARVDVIGFGCTTGSLARGLGHDKEIVSRIERVTKIPAVATAGAVVEALKALKLSRISVGTPYSDQVNALEKRFLEQSGFQIVKMKGLGIVDNTEIGKQSQRVVYALVKEVEAAEAEAVFISCTNLPTISVLEKLEKELEKPVVSSNTATMWAMLRRIGYKKEIRGYGRLLHM